MHPYFHTRNFGMKCNTIFLTLIKFWPRHNFHRKCVQNGCSCLWTSPDNSLVNIGTKIPHQKLSTNTQLSQKMQLKLNVMWQRDMDIHAYSTQHMIPWWTLRWNCPTIKFWSMYNFQKENAIKIPICVAITRLTHIIKKIYYIIKQKRRKFWEGPWNDESFLFCNNCNRSQQA